MGHWGRYTFLLVGLLIGLPTQMVQADKRAFVTGINEYVALPRLSTATNDATATAETLRSLGFAVTRIDQPGYKQFKDKWKEFLSSLKSGDTVVFYFAGHGLQIDGLNLLLLKDSPDTDGGEKAISEKSLNFHELMQQVETRQLAASLYILDACRVSPFVDTSARAKSSQLRGLAPIESLYGAFVMYSAGPDEEALDYLADPKNEHNSVYTRHLLPLLREKETSLVEIAKRVQVEVEEDSKTVAHQQRPAYFDGILGHYYLAKLESSQKRLGPAERLKGDNVIRIGAYSTHDHNCQSLPAPRVKVCAPPQYGRIVTRYETYESKVHRFGPKNCVGTMQRGVAIYYFINEEQQTSNAVEKIEVESFHWNAKTPLTLRDTYEINLATKTAKRVWSASTDSQDTYRSSRRQDHEQSGKGGGGRGWVGRSIKSGHGQ